ncbi:alpha/beta fold hydrolase [Halosimplex aquaticum]|uniref:Alpha/beta fold hydrolase n=1 Tax=Halosimplex aquaticum TaxID=3026162 RepID=A0ABD5YCV0_9EURY|nr:alpha/beta hydrolase [Halosimplex aquaticum]
MSRTGSEIGGVDVAGPADAAEILFVHGTIFNRTMWAPQRDALAERFRVITPDLPGHGSRTDETFRMGEALLTIDDVVESMTDGSVHLVGLSLGGYVATEYARRYPENVDDLVLSGSSANPVGLLGTLSRLVGKATILASKTGLAERATDWLAERYVRSRDLRPEHEEEIVDAGFDLRPFGEAGVEIADEDFRSALASFPGRTLVCNGQWDLLMRLGERDHVEAARDASLAVVEGAGHACNLDRPDEYTDTVDWFVDRAVDVSAAD